MNDIENKKLDFIGIGAQKSGTTWIASCLRKHPQICMGRHSSGEIKKEIHFFDQQYSQGESYYHSFFDHCSTDSVRGEYTPMYLFDPDVPERIHQYNPHIKLIVCLRQPVDRAYSQYRDGKKMWGGKNLLEAIEQAPEILGRGFYAQQLKRFLHYFPMNQIYIGLYEDIKTDPALFMQNMYSFLGVDASYVPQGIQQKKNISKEIRFRSPVLESVRQSIRRYTAAAPFLKKIFKKMQARKVELWLQRFNVQELETAATQPLSEEIHTSLQRAYAADISELEQILGRDLLLWK